GEQGYGYIIDSSGVVIGHPNYEYVLNKFSPMRDAVNDKSLESLARLFKTIIADREGVKEYTYEGNNLYSGFAPIEGTEWIFVTTATENELLESEGRLISNIIIASAIVILIIVVITFFFGNSFTKPIIQTAKSAEKIASLDIREDIDKKYLSLDNEIGTMAKANQSIIDNLRRIIGEINNSSELLAASSEELTAVSGQTADAAQEVSKTVQEIAHGASDQARLTEEGSFKAVTLGDNITKVKGYISSVNESSDKVSDVVDTGIVEINSLYDITKESTSAIEEIARVIADTSMSSKKIGEASNVIEAISAQTNLLSLNASIEAARAGEAGRGFAVVANEIGKLAAQSKSSANTINDIVKELQDNIAIAVKSMERVTNISKEQADSVINSKDKYQLIADAMQLTSKAVDQLEASGDIMDNMKEEIMDVLQNLSAIAEENAASTQEASATAQEETASVEEIANASEGLSELAQGLQLLVAKFKV
ncbi:MAG TPA: methyl-accepting chemotaxis protein, partial [Clostridiales bacterium]|nr:methyl-accepting chemotaxis protein [Clostridiales bacterium]